MIEIITGMSDFVLLSCARVTRNPMTFAGLHKSLRPLLVGVAAAGLAAGLAAGFAGHAEWARWIGPPPPSRFLRHWSQKSLRAYAAETSVSTSSPRCR